MPPHITASRNGSANDLRYTREQLLELFRQQRDAGELNSHLSDLYIGEGDALVNGASTAKWGRRDETDDMAENICWDKQGSILPLGLVDMTEDEREVCNMLPLVTMSQLTSVRSDLYILRQLSPKGP